MNRYSHLGQLLKTKKIRFLLSPSKYDQSEAKNALPRSLCISSRPTKGWPLILSFHSFQSTENLLLGKKKLNGTISEEYIVCSMVFTWFYFGLVSMARYHAENPNLVDISGNIRRSTSLKRFWSNMLSFFLSKFINLIIQPNLHIRKPEISS